MFPLTRLATDLASTCHHPEFRVDRRRTKTTTWKAPSLGLGLPVCSEPAHRSSVQHQGGDTFLQDTLPTILNSPVWNDPTQKSAIFITWDEDYNNLSLGIGNQGNHVVTIVIPSPGAVASRDARRAHSLPIDYYNHYSLQRTIEDSLGLAPLTNNDKYAQPMNEFWT